MATKRASGGRKYGRSAGKSVKSAMDRRKRGTLKRGKAGHGGTVTSRKQAIAIGLAEAREKGAKVPSKRASSKRAASTRSTAKKSTAKKSTARKSTAKKSSAKKSSAKRSSAKKSTAKKSTARKSTRG